jgi:hypothetical protein
LATMDGMLKRYVAADPMENNCSLPGRLLAQPVFLRQKAPVFGL